MGCCGNSSCSFFRELSTLDAVVISRGLSKLSSASLASPLVACRPRMYICSRLLPCRINAAKSLRRRSRSSAIAEKPLYTSGSSPVGYHPGLYDCSGLRCCGNDSTKFSSRFMSSASFGKPSICLHVVVLRVSFSHKIAVDRSVVSSMPSRLREKAPRSPRP